MHPVNSLVLLCVALCVFALAYRYYAAFIAARVLMLDDRRLTPAVRCNNGQDYVPTNKWVVFGHHFAAIAGAGPLIGPTLAAQYGWGPGFVWILVGSVFAGCVHDMIILFASIRHQGQSLALIAKREVSPLTGLLTAIATLAIIVIAMAALGLVVVNALKSNPWGVFSIGMTIPIAVAVGLYMYKIRPGAILSGSFIGVVLVCAAVFLGHGVVGDAKTSIFSLTQNQLALALPIYGFVAAAVPVWLLLAPRDYLSTYMKIGVIAVLAIGIFVLHPTLRMPVTSTFLGGGPIIPGPWWPYVFITIACGAVSGFHSLISSGTTSKMLARESQVTMISYGAMLTEGFVAIMALIAATTLAPGDFYAINVPAASFAALGMQTEDLAALSQMVGIDVAGRTGGGVSLAVGMAHIFSGLGESVRHFMPYFFQFIILFEALFILTTIDAGTRVARYILQDLGGHVYAPFRRVDWIPGAVLASGLASFGWGYLLYTGSVASIWPMFGAANQMLSALALAIGTTVVLRVATRKSYALITAIPCLFLVVVTFYADTLNMALFWDQAHRLDPAKRPAAWVNFSLSAGILLLSAAIVYDNLRVWFRLLRQPGPQGLTAVPANEMPALAPLPAAGAHDAPLA